MSATANPLEPLYEQDETAWLDAMAKLAAAGQAAEMDFRNLADYLDSMARRDRKAVLSRMIVLVAHVLKWSHQSKRRTGSWRATIREQRRRLLFDLQSETLRAYAELAFPEAYGHARLLAADETGLPPETFPVDPPFDLTALLNRELELFDEAKP